MRTIGFIIFISIFITIYGLVNYYIFIRGCQALQRDTMLRGTFLVIFPILAVSFIAGRFLERAWLSPLSDALVWTGSFWLGAMTYFFFAILILDVLRLINHFAPFYPSWVNANYAQAKHRLAYAVAGVVLLLVVAGHVNALLPRVTRLSLRIPKKTDGVRFMSIAVVSDIHLGTIVGRKRLTKIVEKINSLNADLVLLPGDIVDEDIGPVIRENLGAMLNTIRAKFGVLAITGNHEYIGGVERACAYLAEHGITVLRDSVRRVGGGIFVIGREDRSYNQFSGKKRKPLGELMEQVDATYPVILLDHQPFRLEEAISNGIDLQLSGHTHHGQLWPFNYLTRAIYEVSWGYRELGSTHIYVSSGIGTWGPPMRIGNRPEIVHLILQFD
jgi:hypothetical protein